jgi:hypothetical protein
MHVIKKITSNILIIKTFILTIILHGYPYIIPLYSNNNTEYVARILSITLTNQCSKYKHEKTLICLLGIV